MAIETTRGLPSFSEMYTAFKNRGSLGDAINAGVKGYFDAADSAANRKKTLAQADEASASAEKKRADAQNPYADFVDVRSFEPLLSKEQFQVLSSVATPVGDKLMVKKSEISPFVGLVKEQGAERRAEVNEANEMKRQSDLLKSLVDRQTTAMTEAEKRQQASLQAAEQRQASSQQQVAAQDVIREGSKRSAIGKGVDFLFNTERQKEIDRAKKVRSGALGNLPPAPPMQSANDLGPGESLIMNPQTKAVMAVTTDELDEYLNAGWIRQ